ncbi:type II toxin-antitoxin system PemK/MazF family toxin [Candidatus Azambacteria bacterium]|nr:type II toxin-antitoxin system PemK/MazF family toxin [Candidatus Azambacteria bacterium]
MYKIGDIVLTPFPFTDLSGNKVRPALVLGTQKGDDLTVCFISSVSQNKVHVFDIVVDLADKNFSKTGLKLKSIIKTTKMATLDQVVVLGLIGQLDTKNMSRVKKVLKMYFEI